METLITSNTANLITMIVKRLWRNKRLDTAKNSVKKKTAGEFALSHTEACAGISMVTVLEPKMGQQNRRER